MSDEPTERNVEALTEAERGHAYEHFDEDETHMGRCYLESDVERIVAERIAQARREGAAEVEARVSGLVTAYESHARTSTYGKVYRNVATDIRAAIRGDA